MKKKLIQLVSLRNLRKGLSCDAMRSFNFSLRLWMIWPRFYILNATLFQESFNSSFKLGFSITLDSRWWTKCSYGKEVYKSGHNGKNMFQASFN